MHSGEREFQVMTRALAVIHDQINIISNSASELSLLNNSVFREQNNKIESSLERIRNTENDIQKIKKKITSVVVEIGNLISYREDVLKTIFIIDKITGIISRIAFRVLNRKISILKQAKCDNNIITLIEKVIESVCNLDKIVRAVNINYRNIIKLTHEIQKLEGGIDLNDRNILVKAFDRIENTKKLILFKSTVKTIGEKKWQTNVKRLMIHSQYLF